MLFRRDNKYHKINQYRVWDRRGNVGIVLKLIVIVVLCLGLYVLNIYDVKSGGINSDMVKRFLNLKTEDELISEQEIELNLAKQVPGLCDYGVKCFLSGDDRELGEMSYEAQGINVILSDRISYHRKPPNVQHELCKQIDYNVIDFPKASVIIIFYEEPFSVLLRTVHSVINTTPPETLEEIILVDDFSTFTDLKGKLTQYVKTRLPKNVKILRLPQQSGLIKARLAGARLAKGKVLIFLDAHCECADGWLNPLLKRINESPKSVVVPLIDVMDPKTFEYQTDGYGFDVGGFSWDLHFDWHDVPEREKLRQKKECPDAIETCPTYSPTMAGGLFAISKDYFWEIGSYDEQMDGWGGENLEMSFRIWQCGGTLETIPCSRIGHIFREFHPYSFPNDKDTHGINSVRMARVWMDEYQELFYMNRPDLRNHPDIGDITHRKVLREKLKCKSFDWYMKNVYPEKFIPNRNVIEYGRVSAIDENLCFDDLQQNIDEPYNLGIYTCYKPEIAPSQFFALTHNNVLRSERSCATIDDHRSTKYIIMLPCNSDEEVDDHVWEYTTYQQFKHQQSGLCIDRKNLDKSFVHAAVCDSHSSTQKFEFQKNEKD